MAIFRNIILTCILIGITVPKDVLYVCVQLPVFIEHYYHHEDEHGPIDLVSFLTEHLGSDDRHDHHAHDLPLTHNHSSECAQAITLAYAERTAACSPPEVTCSDKCISPESLPAPGFTGNVWQPPKMS